MKPLNKKLILAVRYSSFTLVWLLILIASVNLKADDIAAVKLEIKPTQCVALHHGQNCYSDVVIRFSTSQKADYCLYTSNDMAKPIKCWDNQYQGQHHDEIVTMKNILFTIRQKGQSTVLAQVELKVAWVYRKNSRAKSAWRVF